jgi:hypothetical protein
MRKLKNYNNSTKEDDTNCSRLFSFFCGIKIIQKNIKMLDMDYNGKIK